MTGEGRPLKIGRGNVPFFASFPFAMFHAENNLIVPVVGHDPEISGEAPRILSDEIFRLSYPLML